MDKLVLEVLSAIQDFEKGLLNSSQDILISKIKKFFEKQLFAESSFWLPLSEETLHLSSLQRCQSELKKHKGQTLKIMQWLENCENQVFQGDSFQVWESSGGSHIGFLWFVDLDNASQCLIVPGLDFSLENVSLVESLRKFIQRRIHFHLQMERSQQELFRDSLTKLYNQRYLSQVLREKINEEARYKTPFTILFIDVDHFKKVNDSKGHLVGSSTLVELGHLFADCIRTTDYAFRYGGDEFIILLGHTEGKSAEIIAERIRQKVEAAKFTVHNKNVQVTVSIGLASYPEHASSAEEIIQIADEAMYYGKHKSRNIVYKASS